MLEKTSTRPEIPAPIQVPAPLPGLSDPVEIEAANKVKQSDEFRDLKRALQTEGSISYGGKRYTLATLDRFVDDRVHAVAQHTGGHFEADYIADMVKGNIRGLLQALKEDAIIKIANESEF